jgi:hypothetical protein
MTTESRAIQWAERMMLDLLLAVGRDGNLRIRTRAPRLDRKPMPPTFVASLLRAAVRTATKEI